MRDNHPNPPRDPFYRTEKRQRPEAERREKWRESRAASMRRLRIARKALVAPDFPAEPERLLWYALTTAPQKEIIAATRLHEAGFAAFCPMQSVEIIRTHYRRDKTRLTRRPMLTSVVLCGFEAIDVTVMSDKRRRLIAEVPWLKLWEIEGVTGVIGMGLRPVPVPFGNVVSLARRDGELGWQRGAPAIGQRVDIVEGVLPGMQGRVVAVEGGDVMVKLFGTTGVFAALSDEDAPPVRVARELVV